MILISGRPRYATALKRKQVNFQQKYSLLHDTSDFDVVVCTILSLFWESVVEWNICAEPKPHQNNNITQWEFYQSRDYDPLLGLFIIINNNIKIIIEKCKGYQWFTNFILVLFVDVFSWRIFLWVLCGLGLDTFQCLLFYALEGGLNFSTFQFKSIA